MALKRLFKKKRTPGTQKSMVPATVHRQQHGAGPNPHVRLLRKAPFLQEVINNLGNVNWGALNPKNATRNVEVRGKKLKVTLENKGQEYKRRVEILAENGDLFDRRKVQTFIQNLKKPEELKGVFLQTPHYLRELMNGYTKQGFSERHCGFHLVKDPQTGKITTLFVAVPTDKTLEKKHAAFSIHPVGVHAKEKNMDPELERIMAGDDRGIGQAIAWGSFGTKETPKLFRRPIESEIHALGFIDGSEQNAGNAVASVLERLLATPEKKATVTERTRKKRNQLK